MYVGWSPSNISFWATPLNVVYWVILKQWLHYAIQSVMNTQLLDHSLSLLHDEPRSIKRYMSVSTIFQISVSNTWPRVRSVHKSIFHYRRHQTDFLIAKHLPLWFVPLLQLHLRLSSFILRLSYCFSFYFLLPILVCHLLITSLCSFNLWYYIFSISCDYLFHPLHDYLHHELFGCFY